MAKTPLDIDPYGPSSAGFNPELMNSTPPASSGAGPVIAQMQAMAQQLAQQFVRERHAPAAQGPTIAADPTGRQIYINGKVIDSNDYANVVQAEGLLQQPGDGRVPAGWNKVPASTVAAYIQNIKNPGFGDLFWKNVQQASYGMGELAGGALAALSPEGSAAETAGVNLYKSSKKESDRYAPFQREFGTSPLGQFVPAALGQAVPSMATGLALGGAGGLAGRAAAGPLARAGLTGAARLAPAVGAYTGATAAGVGMGYGDYAQEDLQAGRTPRGSEYGLGPLAYGAIEYAPEALIAAGALGKLGKAMPFSGVGGLKGRALRAGTTGLVGGIAEGTEETAQEELLIRYRDTWEAGYANSPEAANRRVQSFAGGAVPGVLFGGLGGAVSRPTMGPSTDVGFDVGGGPTPTDLDVGTPQQGPVDIDTGTPPVDLDIGGGKTPVNIDVGTRPESALLPHYPFTPWQPRPDVIPMGGPVGGFTPDINVGTPEIPMGGPIYGQQPTALPAPGQIGVVSPDIGASPLIPGAEPIRLPPGFEPEQTTISAQSQQLPLSFGESQNVQPVPTNVVPNAAAPLPPQTTASGTKRLGIKNSVPATQQKKLAKQPIAAPAPSQVPALPPPIASAVEPVAAPVQPVQEVQNAQTVRSDARQIRKRSAEGQPTIRRGPNQSGENLQRPAQEAPRNGEIEQQAQGQVTEEDKAANTEVMRRLGVTPQPEPTKTLRAKKPPITGEEEPNERKIRKKAEAPPTKTITATTPPVAGEKAGPKTVTKKKAPFVRAPEAERTEYAVEAIDKGLGDKEASGSLVKLADVLDQLFVGKLKNDLNKEVAIDRAVNRLAAAYAHGDPETKKAVESIAKYYKHLTDEQVDRIRGVEGGTPQEGGKPRYATGTGARVGHWSVEDARRIVHHIVGRLKRAPKRVVVFNDYTDIPPWLEEEAARQDAATGGEYLQGMTFAERLAEDAKLGRGAMAVSLPETVVFFASYLPAARSAVHLIAAHEMVGHHGFRHILTEETRQQVFTNIAQSSVLVKAQAAGIYDAMRRSRPELNLPASFDTALTSPTRSRGAEIAADAVEEVLADQAAILDTRLLARLWDKVKSTLNYFGVNFDDDTMRYWVRQSRAYVRNGINVNETSIDKISKRVFYATGDNPFPEWQQAPAERLMLDGLQYGAQNATNAYQDMVTRSKIDFQNARFYSNDPQAPGVINRIWEHSKNIVASSVLKGWRDVLSSVIRTTTDVLNSSPNGRKLIRYLRNQHAEVTRLLSKYTIMMHPVTRDMSTDELAVTGGIINFNTLLKGRRITLADYRDINLFRQVIDENGDESWEVDPDALRQLKERGRPRIDEVNGNMVVPVLLPRDVTAEDRAKISERWQKERDRAKKKADELIAKATDEESKKRIEDHLEKTISELNQKEKDALSVTQIWVWQDKMDLSHTVKGHKKLTADSKEFRAALTIYDTISEAAIDQAISKMRGAKVFADEVYTRKISNAIGKSLKDLAKEEVALIKKVAKQYAKMMDATKEYDDETGRLDWTNTADARFFVNNFVGALRGYSGAQATFLQQLEGASPQVADVIASMNRKYQEREKKLDEIATALREQYMSTAMMEEAELFAKKTIATGYAPLSRFGKWEIRMQAYVKDSAGEFTKPLKMEDSPYQALLPYMRFESEGEANYFKDTWDKPFFTQHTYDVAGQEVQFRPKVGYVSQESPASDRISLYDFMEAAQRLGIPLPPTAVENITKALTRADAAVRHQMLRGGNPGWSKDILRTVTEHLDRSAHLSGANVYRPLIDKVLFDESGWFISDQEIADANKEYNDAVNAFGKNSEITWLAKRKLDTVLHFRKTTEVEGRYYKDFGAQLIHWYQNRGGTFQESEHPMFSAIRNIVSTAQLGGSLAQVPIQMMSLVTHSLPTLASYNPNTGFGFGNVTGGAFKSFSQVAQMMFKAGKDIGIIDTFKYDIGRIERLEEAIKEGKLNHLTAEEQRYLVRATREGHLQAAQYNALVGSARGYKNPKVRRFIADTWMRPYTWAEETNRRVTGLTAFRLAYERYRQTGINEQEAFKRSYQDSIDAINNAQGDYAMYARPKWARSGPGAVLFMYKMFMVTTVQLLRNLSPAGRTEMLVALWLLGGAKGLPFWEDFWDIWDTIAQKLGLRVRPVELEIRKFLDEHVGSTAARVAMSGWLEMMTGGSWSPRVGVGDIIPGTGILKAGADTGRELEQVLGPFAGFARGTAGFINRVMLTGDISTDTLRQIPISGVKNLVDAYRYYRDGAIRDGRGYLIAPDAGPQEIIGRALGFYPIAATYQYDMVRLLKQTGDYTRQVKAIFVQEAVAARLQNDSEALQRAYEDVAAWNAAAPDELQIRGFGTSVAKAAQEAQRPLVQRTLKNAPKGIQRNEAEWLTLFGFSPQ